MKKLKVVAFGDSLTAGSALHEGDPNWTDLLASMFDVDIINAGIGGNTSHFLSLWILCKFDICCTMLLSINAITQASNA